MPSDQCEHEGCEIAIGLTACFFPDNESGEPDEYFCTNHAPEHGFCYLCGTFNGGIESFDFAAALGGIDGVCEQCFDQLDGDLINDNHDDDYDYGFYD